MKRWLMVVLLLCAPACGKASADKAATSVDAGDAAVESEAAEVPPTMVQVATLPPESVLSDGLLDAGELPAGWRTLPVVEDDGEPFCGFRLKDLLGLDFELPTAHVTWAADPDRGPAIMQKLSFVPTGLGADAIDLQREELVKCQEHGAAATPFEIVDVAPVGDDSFAVRLERGGTDSAPQFPDTVLLYARHGDLLMGFGALDFNDDAIALLERYASAAMAKASDTLGTTP